MVTHKTPLDDISSFGWVKNIVECVINYAFEHNKMGGKTL